MRNATLDYARLVAAIGILFFHSGAPGAWLGYAALPFFLMLLVCLAWPAAQREALGVYARSRMRRIMIPWVTWSLVYGGLKVIDAIVTGHPLATEFSQWMWLTGPAIHLWFLPFAFVSCLILWPIAQAAKSVGVRVRLGFVVGCVSVALIVLLTGQDASFPTPLAQWAYALPAVMLGIAFAITRGFERRGLASGGLWVATLGGMLLIGRVAGAEQLMVAASALWFCFVLPLPDSRNSRLSAELSLTIYLAHPMVMAILMRMTPLPDKSIALALATLMMTLLLALALQWRSARLVRK